jgi:hypothetical protein
VHPVPDVLDTDSPPEWAPSTTSAVDSAVMDLGPSSSSGAAPAAASAAAQQKALVKLMMRAQVPLLPRRWRRVVVAWRGDDRRGEFRCSCLVDVKAPDGHLEEFNVKLSPELPELLAILREHVRASTGRPLSELRLLLHRSGMLEPSLRVGAHRPERPWPPNFPGYTPQPPLGEAP